MPPLGHVLIVDDDDAIREVVDVFLSGEGYDVITAANGSLALDLVKGTQPDVIVIDALMPVMGGREFVEIYKALPGPHAKIVLLTASSDSEDSLAGFQVDVYLRKPFDLADLLDAVSQPRRHIDGA